MARTWIWILLAVVVAAIAALLLLGRLDAAGMLGGIAAVLGGGAAMRRRRAAASSAAIDQARRAGEARSRERMDEQTDSEVVRGAPADLRDELDDIAERRSSEHEWR